MTTWRCQRIGDWAKANHVEIACVPTNSSWLNRIEVQFTTLRYFTLDGTGHATHKEQVSMIHHYIIWRNCHADDRRLRAVVDRANVARSDTGVCCSPRRTGAALVGDARTVPGRGSPAGHDPGTCSGECGYWHRTERFWPCPTPSATCTRSEHGRRGVDRRGTGSPLRPLKVGPFPPKGFKLTVLVDEGGMGKDVP